ncbi:MAG: PAS domain S-box protein, partial [Candidatus Omnitrophica bacterium]|nr:PAS domain S-box protein [Candidatus Omnitrophota bacterium]
MSLIHNMALLVALAVGLQFIHQLISRKTYLLQVLSGILFGMTGILLMMTPLHFAPGVIYDGRSIVLSLAGMFGGFVPGVIGAAICVIYRLYLGGAGAAVGVAVIVEATTLGILYHNLRQRDRKWNRPERLLLFGLIVHVIMMLLQLLIPGDTGWEAFEHVGPPVVVVFPIVFVLAAHILLEGERRRTFTRELSVSEEQYRTFFEKNHAAMLLVAPEDGSIVDANPAAVRFYGWSREELKSKKVTEIDNLSPEEYRNRVEEVLSENNRPFFVKHQLADGTIRDVEVSAGPVPLSGQQFVFCIVHDVSDRRKAEEALQIEHQRLNFLINASRVGTWEWNVQTGKVLLNERWAQMAGYSLAELEPITIETWHNLAHPEDLSRSEAILESCLRGESDHYECEVRMRHKEGHWVWILDRGRVMEFDHEGNPLWMFGTLTDITHLKEFEASLRESEERFRTLFVKSPVSVVIHDAETGEILDANPAAIQAYRLNSLEELKVHDFWCEPPYSFEDALAKIRQTSEKGSHNFEWFSKRADGEELWERVYLTPIQLNGKTRILAKAIDITERKRAEEDLKTRQKYLQTVLDTTADGFWILDTQGSFIEVNDSFCRMTGFSRDELIGHRITDLNVDESLEDTTKRIEHIISEGSDTFRARHRRKDGSTFPVEVSATYLSQNGGQFICFGRDLTEREEGEREVQEASERLRESIRAANVGLWDWDLATNRVYFSREWKQQIGYKPEEIDNDYKEWERRVHPDDLPLALERIGKAVTDPEAEFTQEFRLRHKNGSYRWIFAQGSVYRDEKGKPVRFLGSHIDITNRKKQAEHLVLLGEMLDEAPAAITVHDMEGHFLYANRHCVSLHGFESEDEFLATNLHDLDVPESREIKDKHYAEVSEKGIVQFEASHYRKDGSIIPIEVLCKLIEWEGQPAVLSIATDITERRHATQQIEESHARLRISEERFRMLLNHVSMVSVQGYSSEGTVLYWNEGSREIYGYTEEEALGKNLLDLIIPPPMREEVRSAIDQMISTGESIPSGELELMRKDGSLVSVFSAHCVLERPGLPTEFYCVDVDLTPFKETERERERLQEQLNQAQKMESVGRLAGGVAHDFNNMLGVILGHAEIALQDLQDDVPLRSDLEEIRKAAKRSADLTRQLLAFARKQTVAPKVLDLNETVESMLKMLRRLIGEDIDLLWKPGRDVKKVKIDPAQIDQILANLCVNARDAIGHSTGKVTIETTMVDLDEDDCAS